MGKVANTSNLAMRFYVRDGWGKAELDACCTRGEFNIHFPEDVEQYYSLDIGGSYDVDKLLPLISEIERRFSEQHQKTDRQLLEAMNWQ